MLESLEKLRKYTICDVGERYTACLDVNEIADAIQAEVDANYLELPKDEDGMPIRVGDVMMLANGEKGLVTSVSRNQFHIGSALYTSNMYRHSRPRTVEDVLFDFMCDYGNNELGNRELVDKYAAERKEGGDD